MSQNTHETMDSDHTIESQLFEIFRRFIVLQSFVKFVNILLILE